MSEKSSSTSFWMALLAIVISLIGTGVSIVEANILRDQQALMTEEKAASVWPYLVLNGKADVDKNQLTLSYELNNKGVGPALIGDLTLRNKIGKGINPIQLIDQLEADHPELEIIPTASKDSKKEVLAAGDRYQILELLILTKDPEKAPINLAMVPIMQDITIEYCYCSIYGDCWDDAGNRLVAETSCGGREFLR